MNSVQAQAAALSPHEMTEVMIALVKEVVPRRLHAGLTIGPDTVLADLGITSMAKISLAFKIEQKLGIDLTAVGNGVADVRTVQDVVQLLAQAASAT